MADTTALDRLPSLAGGQKNWKSEASKAFMEAVKENLAKAGLPRTSTLNGGAITGFTDHYGSTGFSVSFNKPGGVLPEELPTSGQYLNFHIVLSGKVAGLEYVSETSWYEDDDDEEQDFHRPLNPESLNPRIKKVFEDMGLEVLTVCNSGYQTLWDDDVDYNVVTKVV